MIETNAKIPTKRSDLFQEVNYLLIIISIFILSDFIG
jgi:hypothetical protein